MDLLFYNELDTKQIEKNYKKVIDYLRTDNFKSAEIKKMQNSGFYRAKLDEKNRLLFKFSNFNNKTYILILEVILNHDYEKSKFLRGAEIDESKISPIGTMSDIPTEDIKPLPFINTKHKHFYMLDKILSFDEHQQEIYQAPAPLIIIGSAGSGKTVLTLEKLKKLKGNIAYISLSPYLVENAEKVYYSNNYNNEEQDVDFLSFREFIDGMKKTSKQELNYQAFEYWFLKHQANAKIKEPYKIYEEFKGVLTGSVPDAAFLSKDNYLNLGVKQSIFLKQEREKIYEIFEKFRAWLSESDYFDSNILAFDYLNLAQKKYDFVVVDEVQDITIIQLKLILSTLKTPNHFILSGDSNQIVHPNFFSWSKIKTMFYFSDLQSTLTRILSTNYRNSKEITELSNTLLKIKNARFGSIDKESTYLINSISANKGELKLYEDTAKIKTELNTKTVNSAKYAVLVMNNQQKTLVKQFFKTPLIFSIQEAKGLEYENIILVNFTSSYENEFYEITRGVSSEMLTDELIYSRAKNKEDKDLDVYKFFINSLYVAFTRGIRNIYMIEKNTKQRLLELLELNKTEQKLTIENQKSSAQEWLNEAKRLEMQGKYEQAQQIRDRISGIDYLSPEEYNDLRIRALDPTKTEQEVKRERKDLYKYAESRKRIDDIRSLAELKFQRAILFMQDYKKTQKEFTKNIRVENLGNITKAINTFGTDFRCFEEEMTGLIYAVKLNSDKMIDFFLQQEVDILAKDSIDFNAFQHFLRIYVEENRRFQKQNAKQTSVQTSKNRLFKYFDQLRPQHIKFQVGEHMVKLNPTSMLYFMIYALKIISKIPNFRTQEGFAIADFVDFFEFLPDAIIPEKRKKRQYINSLLANNEVERDYMYNRFIFKRVGHGIYNINPDLIFIE